MAMTLHAFSGHPFASESFPIHLKNVEGSSILADCLFYPQITRGRSGTRLLI